MSLKADIVQDEPPKFQLKCTVSLGFSWGMAVHPANGQVLVSLEDGPSRVKLLNAEGWVLQCMQLVAGRPWGAAVDARRGLLMVANSKNHRVQVYDSTNGQLVHQLGAQGVGPGQFQEPCSMMVDLEGCIVMADRGNHWLQVLDKGGFIHSIRTQGSKPGQLSSL